MRETYFTVDRFPCKIWIRQNQETAFREEEKSQGNRIFLEKKNFFRQSYARRLFTHSSMKQRIKDAWINNNVNTKRKKKAKIPITNLSSFYG